LEANVIEANTKAFLSQTGQTAFFALREFFRPLIVIASFLKSRLASAKPEESAEGSSTEKARHRNKDSVN
jgi:hypothetical protein